MEKKWKLAQEGLRSQVWMNLLIFVQLVITFFICMSCVSVFLEEYSAYAAIEKLSHGNGNVIFHHGFIDTDSMFLESSKELEEFLPGNEIASCYNVLAEVQYENEKLVYQVMSYDSKLIDAYHPKMEEGTWLDACKGEDILHVVVSKEYGLEVGDTLELGPSLEVKPGVEIVHIPAKVVGVLDKDAYVLGYQIGDPERRDSSWLFQSANPEYGNSPLLLMNQKEFMRVKENLGCIVIPSEIDNLTWFSHEKEMPEGQKTAQGDAINQMAQSIEMQLGYEELRENTALSFKEEMLQIIPVFMVALLVTLISEVSAGAISARIHLYRYGVYQLCGLPVRGCLGIHVRGSGLLTGTALVCAFLSILGMEQFGWAIGGTVIRIGWIQMTAGILLAGINLLIACWIPIRIIRERSVYEILNAKE